MEWTPKKKNITRSRLAELLDDEAEQAATLAPKPARDAAKDIRAGHDALRVVYPNTVWGGERSRRNCQMFQWVKTGQVTVVDD